MKLTEKQKNCPYCHNGWFAGKSGWQHANTLFLISDSGSIETFVNGIYGYCEGAKFCPFCGRLLGNEVEQ